MRDKGEVDADVMAIADDQDQAVVRVARDGTVVDVTIPTAWDHQWTEPSFARPEGEYTEA